MQVLFIKSGQGGDCRKKNSRIWLGGWRNMSNGKHVSFSSKKGFLDTRRHVK